MHILYRFIFFSVHLFVNISTNLFFLHMVTVCYSCFFGRKVEESIWKEGSIFLLHIIHFLSLSLSYILLNPSCFVIFIVHNIVALCYYLKMLFEQFFSKNGILISLLVFNRCSYFEWKTGSHIYFFSSAICWLWSIVTSSIYNT